MKKSQHTEIFNPENDLNLTHCKKLGMLFHDEYCNTVDINEIRNIMSTGDDGNDLTEAGIDFTESRHQKAVLRISLG